MAKEVEVPMVQLRNVNSGAVVSRDAAKPSMGSEWEVVDGSYVEAVVDDSGEGYEANTVPELRDEIDRRNEGRDEADLIPSDGLKADLVAALEADDEAN